MSYIKNTLLPLTFQARVQRQRIETPFRLKELDQSNLKPLAALHHNPYSHWRFYAPGAVYLSVIRPLTSERSRASIWTERLAAVGLIRMPSLPGIGELLAIRAGWCPPVLLFPEPLSALFCLCLRGRYYWLGAKSTNKLLQR